MKITDHKLPEGIALTFRVPEGNIKHPLILLCHGFCGTRVLSDNESKVFFEKVKGQYPEMDIKIPFLTVMETLQYKPAESAAKVQCPVLVVIAGQDSVNPPEQGRALYDAVASGTKELYEEADACHYDIYEGAFFERVAAVQTQWFKKHL
ncbi:alpha/beta hydrolase [Escherichia coli]|uniref:alpha/beta hydrolase n=1 Tax=Escherichia coli TaxID=562 RepID=UPI00132FAFA2|nr:alpha/beta hydrolase [Escherichia coli]HDU5747045.1 alpha/beta hydrolase [Escherichia coli]HDU6412162.1 alpha/beta hydrolase [Escherichia coli]HDU6752554.1 alpha/beta hydrolase [Escherichia coli]